MQFTKSHRGKTGSGKICKSVDIGCIHRVIDVGIEAIVERKHAGVFSAVDDSIQAQAGIAVLNGDIGGVDGNRAGAHIVEDPGAAHSHSPGVQNAVTLTQGGLTIRRVTIIVVAYAKCTKQRDQHQQAEDN